MAPMLALLALLVLAPASARAAGVSDATAVLLPQLVARPGAGGGITDPVFGTTLRRVSATSATGGFETHVYSQLQAFSRDGAYLLLTGSDGYVVRRSSDFGRVAGLDTSEWNAPRWHPRKPHSIVHFDRNDDSDVTLQLTNVETGVTRDLFTLPAEYRTVVTSRSFDEISRNGRWLAGVAQRTDGAWVIFALHLRRRELGAQIPIDSLFTPGPCAPDPTWGKFDPDWVGVSPRGRTLVVGWARDGTQRCSGLETFDPRSGAFVGRVYDGHQHGDLGVTPDGREFYMTFELTHPLDNGRPSLGMRMLPGTATASPPTYLTLLDWGGGHVSCRGPAGVCLVTHDGWPDNPWTPFEREVFLQYTDGRVLRLAHHRSSSCGYWVQPRASLSPDGKRAVFASDWAEGTAGDGCADDSLGRGDPWLIDIAAP